METMLYGTQRLLAFSLALFGCYWCLTGAQLALPTDANSIKKLDELLPAGYATPNISLADVQRVLQQKCQRANAANNATKLVEDLQAAAGSLYQCVSGLANVTAVMQEVEQARPRGDLDVVFEKYCLRMPQAITCLDNFNAAVLPCLTSEERSKNKLIVGILKNLLNFVCFKNGEHIALFIAEEGPECFDQQKEHIGACFNKSFGHYLPNQANISQVVLPELVFGPRQCVDLHTFETCVVHHLESCSNITPSNLVESILHYVRKEADCLGTINRVAREQNEALGLKSGASSSWRAATTLSLSLVLGLTRISV